MQQKGKKCWAKKLFKADNVTSLLIQKSFKINHNSNCTHNCLVNVFIKFPICFKQYAGNNADTFRKRWYIYKNSTRLSRGESCIQRHFFQSPGNTGFVEHVCNIKWQNQPFHSHQTRGLLETNIFLEYMWLALILRKC